MPLSSFIVFNKKVAGEKFANLFGKSIDEIFSCDEEIKEHEEFSKKLLQKILNSKLVADFNLGKKTKYQFISELLSFLQLPNYKLDGAIAAWNSLINFDERSNTAFEALLNLVQRRKSIYFIADTNELHAEKILALFSSNSIDNLSFFSKSI